MSSHEQARNLYSRAEPLASTSRKQTPSVESLPASLVRCSPSPTRNPSLTWWWKRDQFFCVFGKQSFRFSRAAGCVCCFLGIDPPASKVFGRRGKAQVRNQYLKRSTAPCRTLRLFSAGCTFSCALQGWRGGGNAVLVCAHWWCDYSPCMRI